MEFYLAAFPHWIIRGGGENDWYGKRRKWIHFGDNYQYLAFNDSGVDKNRSLKGHQVGLAHFAFVTSDIQGVSKRLLDAGFEIANSGARDSYRDNIYFVDPNGYEVEFVEYKSDIPEERNTY